MPVPEIPALTPARRKVLSFVLRVAVAAAVVWIVSGLIGRIDWRAVGDALATLSWWAIPVLILVLLLRQVLSSAPVARFVPRLGLRRSLHNEMAANLVATVAPPPSDMAVRVSMFRSWGVDPVDGMAGVTLATVVFWGARFLAPVIGLATFVVRGVERRQWAVAGVSAAIAIAIITLLVLVLRSHRWADAVGRVAARTVTKVVRPVDEEAWAATVVDFRSRVDTTLRKHLAPALTLMLAGIVLESFILLASLRLVGVPSSLTSAEIVGTFLLAYPMTMLPFMGLGALDATLIATWIDNVPDAMEPTLLAGTIVWRVVTLGGTLVIGALSLGWWRWSLRRQGLAVPSADAVPSGSTLPGESPSPSASDPA